MVPRESEIYPEITCLHYSRTIRENITLTSCTTIQCAMLLCTQRIEFCLRTLFKDHHRHVILADCIRMEVASSRPDYLPTLSAAKTSKPSLLVKHHICVREAPWSAANRLHGQRTGAFSWRPVLGLSRKTYQFRFDPTQNCAPGWWCDRESSVYHLALEMYSGIIRHATNPLALSRMPTKHQLHPCPHPTHHSHDYHTRTLTVTNPTAFHAQL